MSQSQLERIKQQEAQLRARRQKLEAAEKTRERKKDLRRKILFGAHGLEQLKRGNPAAKELEAGLTHYLTRDGDRALFELEPKAGSQAAQPAKEEATETA